MGGAVRKFRLLEALAALVCLVAFAAEAGATDRKPGDDFWECQGCPEMVVVPAGSFIMGADGRFDAEKPPHEVTIAKPFAIGRFEVTFDQWEVCRAEGGCDKDPDDHKWGKGIRPVVNINWAEAVAYADWLSRKTGATYRLPSEAEWEYAARGGTSTQYWWGDDPGSDNANCRTCLPEIPPRDLSGRLVQGQSLRALRRPRQCLGMGAGLLEPGPCRRSERWIGAPDRKLHVPCDAQRILVLREHECASGLPVQVSGQGFQLRDWHSGLAGNTVSRQVTHDPFAGHR